MLWGTQGGWTKAHRDSLSSLSPNCVPVCTCSASHTLAANAAAALPPPPPLQMEDTIQGIEVQRRVDELNRSKREQAVNEVLAKLPVGPAFGPNGYGRACPQPWHRAARGLHGAQGQGSF